MIQKHAIRKILITALAFLCIATLCVSPAMADEPATGYADIPEDEGFEQHGDSAAAYLPRDADGNPITYFSLVDEGMITSVKNQEDYQSCWAFAAIAAIESNIIKQGYATADELDLSEHHLAYTYYNRIGITSGDSILPRFSGLAGDDHTYNTTVATPPEDWYMHFSNPLTVSIHMMTGIGPIDESLAPFSKMIELYKLDPETQEIARAYTLDPELTLENDYVVTGIYFASFENPEMVKHMLMEMGAGAIMYCTGPDMIYASVNPEDPTTISSLQRPNTAPEGWITTYYESSTPDANHAVTLVGWDDTIPVELFKDPISGERPTNPGGWLIKNSWSEEFADDGYFWLSYETPSLLCSPAIFYEVTPISEISTIYQYDGTSSPETFDVASSVAVENHFKTEMADTITDVAFMIASEHLDYDEHLDYKVELYKGDPDASQALATGDHPIRFTIPKKPLATAEGIAAISGYYHVELSKPVSLPADTEFTVRVTFTSRNVEDPTICLPIDMSGTTARTDVVSTVSEGQSYVIYDGEKHDIYEIGGCFRIKAYGSAGA